MEIIKQTEGISKKDIYLMVNDPSTKAIKTLENGTTLGYKAFVLYTDTDDKGNEVKLLALQTTEGNFTTNSKTFIDDFIKAVDFLGEQDILTVTVISDSSKSGRTYFRCSIK